MQNSDKQFLDMNIVFFLHVCLCVPINLKYQSKFGRLDRKIKSLKIIK